ncbi:hypothetical protein [Clostridium sp.]|uniref:hypothetical protein n=1 Tax=Clostridium sp. TaxID=1506 RepID=UPI0028405517|nr:hypothetical protein [Clostridium sp.]MDR3598117.1 hypothetical protein [Clostridium sp.]
MNQICAKVYYLITTGEVLFSTAEIEGYVPDTTKEQYIEAYPQLQGKTTDEIDFIELPYGTLVSTFTPNVKSMSVDVTNKTLNIVNYTQDELNAMQQQAQQTQTINNRISDISNYLNLQGDSSISNVENAIIQNQMTDIENGDI